MGATGGAARGPGLAGIPTTGRAPLARLSPCESVNLLPGSARRERVRAPVRDVDIAVVRDLGQICRPR